MNNLKNNNLYRFLIKTFGEAFHYHLQQLNIGSDYQNNTVYLFKDAKNQITHSKIIHYDKNTGKRLKGNESPIKPFGEPADCFYGFYENNYIHIFSKSNGFDTHTLFNEHLLSPKSSIFSIIENRKYDYSIDTSIILVESEKSAVIASFFFPKYIWIGIGGANRISNEKIAQLENRNVFIFFDNDDGGRNGAENITNKLKHTKIFDPRLFYSNLQKSYDISDLLIDNYTRDEDIYDITERFYIQMESRNEYE